MALGLFLTSFIQVFGLTKDKVGNGIHWHWHWEKIEGKNAESESESESENERLKGRSANISHSQIQQCNEEDYPGGFQMPLHYPRYKEEDYDNMEDWKLDMLLREYGLCFKGTLDDKRAFVMATFLWPDDQI